MKAVTEFYNFNMRHFERKHEFFRWDAYEAPFWNEADHTHALVRVGKEVTAIALRIQKPAA